MCVGREGEYTCMYNVRVCGVGMCVCVGGGGGGVNTHVQCKTVWGGYKCVLWG